MPDVKTIALLILVGGAAGAAGAMLVQREVPKANDQALVATVRAMEARIEALETRPAPPAQERQAARQAAPKPEIAQTEIAQTGGTAVLTARPGGNPRMFRDGFQQLMDPDLDPEARLTLAREMLDSPMPPARLMAIRTLAELGDPQVLEAVQKLVADSADDRRGLRMAAGAIDSLATVDDSAVDMQLYDYLNHENQSVRVAAARALEARGDEGPMSGYVADIARGLDSADSGDRSRAAQELGRTRSPSATDHLVDALVDDSSEVRLRAVQSLGWTGGDDAIDALTGALEDPVAEVRSAASRSLNIIRNPEQTTRTAAGVFFGP